VANLYLITFYRYSPLINAEISETKPPLIRLIPGIYELYF